MGTGIGKRIKAKRTELGISQTELAHRMGFVNKSTISKVESGLEDNMTSDRLERYAKALGVTPTYLLGLEDNLSEVNADALADLIKYTENKILSLMAK